MRASGQAVSESLGYILISTILFISFTTIFLIGYPVYNNYVDSGHMENIEKSFSLLAHNGNMVAMQKSTLSTSEMKIYGGTLAVRDAGSISISYYGDVAGTSQIGSSGLVNLSTLEYCKGAVKIGYIFGSVCRAEPGGSVMLRDPEVSGGADMLLIPVINLYQSQASIAGDTLIRINFMTPYYSKLYQTIVSPQPITATGVRNITIRVTGDYAPGLGSYFNEQLGFTETTETDGTVVLTRTYPSGTSLTLTRSDLSISVN